MLIMPVEISIRVTRGGVLVRMLTKSSSPLKGDDDNLILLFLLVLTKQVKSAPLDLVEIVTNISR
jgi:hypothetical protein